MPLRWPSKMSRRRREPGEQLIVAFGTYDAKRHPRVGILIDGLRAHGHEVVEVNEPLGLTTAERVRMLRQPWRLPLLAARLGSRWTRLIRAARAVRASSEPAPDVLVGYMGHFDVLLARRLFPESRIVLDHLIFAGDTAKDRGTRGLRARLLGGLDRRAIAAADIVVVDTGEHEAMLPSGTRSVVVPVGARDEWFFPSAPARPVGPLSVVFFGLFTPLQGAPVIARGLREALDAGADIRATIVGTGQDWDEARSALGDDPRVTWLDWVDPAELPQLVASHDVCLGIFGDSGKALRVVPNKVYEGAAAGCAIVTSDTRPQREALGEAGVFIPPGDASALAQVLSDWADHPERVASARRLGGEVAQRYRAEHVVVPLVSSLQNEAR